MPNYHMSAAASLGERLSKMLIQLATLVLLAKFLDPSSVGELYYCIAIVSSLLFLNTFGCESLFVQNFLTTGDQKQTYVGQIILFRVAMSGLCVLLCNLAGYWLVESSTRLLLFVISMYHFFAPFSTLQWLFQAKGRGEIPALFLIFGEIIALLLMLFFLRKESNIVWLGVAYVAEFAISSTLLVSYYVKKYQLSFSPVCLSDIKKFAVEGFPLMISSALILLYSKVDQVMLGYLGEPSEVGIYVSGSRLSEAWFLLILTLVSVYFPKYIKIRNEEGMAKCLDCVVRPGQLLLWGSVLVAIVATLISPWLIDFLYGKAFARSADVLNITIWALPFVVLGVIFSKLYVINNNHSALVWRSFFGLVLNITLNLFLIVPYGPLGAAVSTLISQIGVGFVFNYIANQKDIAKLQTQMIFLTSR